MDESKLVDKIGAFHLPVEIAQYGSKQAMERMAAYGWNPVLRVRDGKTFVTDNGNFIAHLHLGAGFDIQDVYSTLILSHFILKELAVIRREGIQCAAVRLPVRSVHFQGKRIRSGYRSAGRRRRGSGDGRGGTFQE